MAGRAFVSRRRRRCALGSSCLHGGTIAVGDLALRPKPHAYVHALDVEAATNLIADVLASFSPVLEAWKRAIRTIADALAPLARHLAELLEVPSVDALAFDACPNDCWRCDAAPAVDSLGLCSTCRVDLVESR